MKDSRQRINIGPQASNGEAATTPPNWDRVFSRWADYMETEAPDLAYYCRTCNHGWEARPVGLRPKFTIEAGGVPRLTNLEQIDDLPKCPRCGSLNRVWVLSGAAQQQYEDEMRRRCSPPRYIRGPIPD